MHENSRDDINIVKIAHSEKTNSKPSNIILKAFGATETLTLLPGGQGTSFKSGGIVLKPATDNEETSWICGFYEGFESKKIRVPKPIRSTDGKFVFGGWQAFQYLEGEHRKNCWAEIADLCVLFHEEIKHHPKPECFERREKTQWVLADKIVFGEMNYEFHPALSPWIEKLQKKLQPVGEKSQLIHGDFGGNVLFADNLSPAVIDFSPYFRPALLALGVVVADAIVWEGADFSLIKHCERYENFHQNLIRAELRRIIEIDTCYHLTGRDCFSHIKAHIPLTQYLSNL